MNGRHNQAVLNPRAAPDGPAPAQTWSGSSVFTQVTVLTRRAVLDYLSDPRAVVAGLTQPMIWLFLLTSLFSKFGRPPGFPPGVSYFDYVLPAVLVDNALQTALQTGTGLIEELKNGIVPRLRSLPVLPSSLLTARSITGLVRIAVQTLIMMTLAQLTHGNFSRGGLAGLTVSFGLTLLMGWSLGWVFLAISAWIRRTETMQSLGFMVLFTLVFSSSAYVPVRDLPTVLRVVAGANPLTYAINATRTILLQTPGGAGAILPAILSSLVIGAAGTFAAVLLFRRPLDVTRR
jgi:ABC-2 type transport system permease protein